MKTAALATFAVSIGFLEGNQRARYQDDRPFQVYTGSAIALDPHHLLTAAHCFDTTFLGPYDDHRKLKYKYVYSLRSLIIRITVRHDRRDRIDRSRMFVLPDSLYDFEVNVIAYGDGRDVSSIRIKTDDDPIPPIGNDFALLYSTRPLRCQQFPQPGRFHVPPNDSDSTKASKSISLIAYNGIPDPEKIYRYYPKTSKEKLDESFKLLYPDQLSYATGVTSNHFWSPDTIYHRVSSYNGASGCGIFDQAGRLIGISMCHQKHTNNI